jgi:glycosyltransferase involved in cell wall biosynthesis
MTQVPHHEPAVLDAHGVPVWRDCLSLASFWPPDQLGPQDAWLEHAPFAFWLIDALRPGTLVELGTHGGFSYFTFCQAVQLLQLETRCWAVDTWRGDEHAGFYAEDVFEEVRRYHDRRYSAFSTLVRASFDDAVPDFQDGTIDLLHIDGRHFYDDVKHDFETWRPKLSARSVVLFHDTNVRELDFGVCRLWSELRLRHRHFEFLHGHGLGILGIGDRFPPRIEALWLASGDAKTASQIRSIYNRLGSTVALELRARRQGSELRQWKIETDALRKDIALRADEAATLRNDLARRTDEADALRKDRTLRTDEADALWADLARRAAEAEALRTDLARRTDEADALRTDLARRTDEAEALRRDLALRADEADALRTHEVDALRGELAARTLDATRLRAEIVAQGATIGDLRNELTSRFRHVDAIRGELAERERSAETLKRTISALAAENAQLGSELTVTRDEMANMRSLLIARSAELGDARRRIAELGGTLDEQQREAHVMRTSTSWLITQPIRKIRRRHPRLADYGRRILRRFLDGTGVDEHEPATDGHEREEPGRDFEGDFLDPYYRSAGFSDPPATTYARLREAGWPVYATRAAAESVAAVIRGHELFDAEEYATHLGQAEGIDPVLHYVIVGERLGLLPSKGFDATYYRQRYPDVSQAKSNLLAHYLSWGRHEGRRPFSVAAGLRFERSRIDLERDTILLITHQASRTGAPIVAYNIARRLGQKYNVVAVLLTGGELVPHFDALCSAVVGPLTYADWHPVEAEYLVKHLTTSYRVFMAIANSIETRIVFPALAHHLVPVVTLAHEFASYTRPEGAMGQALDWSTQVVFSAELVARAAQKEHPTLAGRPIHVLRQGRCDVPARWDDSGPPARSAEDLARAFRPKGAEHALVVLGCGTVHLRKGVDLFLACAAAVAAAGTRRPVRFVWIGHGYDPRSDVTYSCYLADQIARSGLEGSVAILDEIEDLDSAYRLADVFFLSSRLDPLPNVTIEAALRGIPVVCFDDATGIGEVLAADPRTRRGVVSHLDVAAAARVIAEFADDEDARHEAGATTRHLAEATFDMDRYVNRIDELGVEAARIMRQRAQDFGTIREDTLFDERVYIPPEHPSVTRDEAIIGFLARWTAVGLSRQPASNGLFRRPCAGFHPQIYAHERFSGDDAAPANPLADFIRRGKPPGPWAPDLIAPTRSREASRSSPLRIGLHAHFFYPELADDFMRRMGANRWPCHLLLSTDSETKARALRESTVGYERGEVLIRVVPNRGRDLGPLLTTFAEEVASQYDIIGHLHGKRSLMIADARLGETWREFLWQHLLGDRHPMMDTIVDRFAADETLGLVFAADPHLSDWDANLAMATDLADRMGIEGPLPPFFDFPVGTMFWARSAALRPLLELGLGWADYPHEPVPIDGTILHALERLLPFVARRAGYGFAVTHVPRLTW